MRRMTLCCLTLGLFVTAPLHAQPDSLWSRTYGGGGNNGCRSLVQTSDGGYALAGYTRSFGAGDYDFWLVRTDENGDRLWSRAYGGERDEWCISLIQTTDGGFVLAGCTYSFGAGDSDFWLVRTDENGDSLWSHTYGGQYDDYCNSLVQNADGGFALAGSTSSYAGEEDLWLVKLGAENSVPGDEAAAPLHFGLDAVYPNPFNATAVASYNLQVASWVSLCLYDLSGRLVETLMEGWQEAGEHRVVIDAKGGQPGMAVLPSGIYLLRLTDGRQTELRKVCLLK